MCQQLCICFEFHNFRVPFLWCKAHFYTQGTCVVLHHPEFSFGTISTCGNRACDAPPSRRMEELNHEEGTPTAPDIKCLFPEQEISHAHMHTPTYFCIHTPTHTQTSVAGW